VLSTAVASSLSFQHFLIHNDGGVITIENRATTGISINEQMLDKKGSTKEIDINDPAVIKLRFIEKPGGLKTATFELKAIEKSPSPT
jgi:hypothetical protein